MNIHEYQAKELLAGFGVAIPHGGIAFSPDNVAPSAAELGTTGAKVLGV
jgi:succinyl-CoA synthetase beta subunit